jgi:hypothetical protein
MGGGNSPWSGDRYEAPRPSRPEALPIFFPPSPPVLGSPVPLPNPLLSSQPAPQTLEEYVNEFFYPALSTRFAQKKIAPRLLEKITAYRTAKVKLQDELRAKLVELRNADHETRTRELALFAQRQTPQIEALEKTAEQLREELIRGELFRSSIDWNVTRDWRLGKSLFRSAGDAILAQQQVMRAAAFYQRGLLPEQRALLREIAMELRDVNPRNRDAASDGVAPPLFFSPSPARLRLPAGLPVELREKIARYENEKSLLKQELRDTIYTTDKAFFSGTRQRAIEALAESQWPRLVALEELAEKIRVDFARLSRPLGPPDPPPVSAALAARIIIYLSEKQMVEADILAKVAQIKQKFAIQRISAGSGAGDVKLILSPGSQTQNQIDALRATLAEFNRDIGSRHSDLRKDLEGIRRDLARETIPGEGETLEDILYDYAIALQQREEWRLYTDYQSAMLTPGLSPPQRRLLFDVGVEKLDLPLPGWELQRVHVIL